jgi:hypothetical protein
MTRRRMAATVVLLCASMAVAVLLCEAGARLLLNPADYLSVNTVADDVLGITVASGSAGFDEWGFRNRRVPTAASAVALGDSHTYGNTASMDDAWPAVVARRTGRDVYNLGLGGYGPNQYFHLLTTKALALHPQWVVCGLYMGDDFENAFSITYGLPHWASLRRDGYGTVDANIWDAPEGRGWGATTRNWLSRNSIVYRLLAHGPLIGLVKERLRLRQVASGGDPLTTALVVEDRNIREAFRPVGLANRLDQARGEVREGMRITFQLLRAMDGACRARGCRFLVVIIPTKEMVFARYLEGNAGLHLHEALDRLIAHEGMARETLLQFMREADIAHVDALPALREAVGDQLYARTTRDMHPGRNGYRVIGEVVAAYLEKAGLRADGHNEGGGRAAGAGELRVAPEALPHAGRGAGRGDMSRAHN